MAVEFSRQLAANDVGMLYRLRRTNIEGAALGFDMEIDHEAGRGAFSIHADEYGEPEQAALRAQRR
jgi:hypothetical protein